MDERVKPFRLDIQSVYSIILGDTTVRLEKDLWERAEKKSEKQSEKILEKKEKKVIIFLRHIAFFIRI